LGLFLVSFSLVLHLCPWYSSALNLSNEEWNPHGYLVSNDLVAYAVHVHAAIEPAFVRRPLTTWIVQGAMALGLPAAWAFIIPSFLLLLVAGLLVRRIAVRWGMDAWSAALAQVAFHLLPTVLFLFGITIYGYDEPLQYVLILLALEAFTRDHWWLCLLLFSFALIARESTLLLFPSLAWVTIAHGRGSMMQRWTRAGSFAVPLIIFALFLWVFLRLSGLVEGTRDDLQGRWEFFEFNFANGDMAGESLCFAFLALGLPLFLLARYVVSVHCSVVHKQWMQAFLIALLLNTAVVFVAAKAREARLFALPLLMLLPLLGAAWRTEMERHGGFRAMLAVLRSWPYVLAFMIALCVIILISDHVFVLSDTVPSQNLYHEYFIGQALFMSTCILSDLKRASKTATRSLS